MAEPFYLYTRRQDGNYYVQFRLEDGFISNNKSTGTSNYTETTVRRVMRRFGITAIFNTDQGSQFTSDVFIKVLVDYDIQISMDGKDRALDNIRIECLWRSLKYEDIYLKRYETMKDLKAGIDAYFKFYNTARFHQSLDYNVPDEMYKCFQHYELGRKQSA